MNTERVNGEQTSVVEWGSDGPAKKLGWLAADRPVVRGAGFGLALTGFALVVLAQVLPWMSYESTPMEQDFPTTAGGHIEVGLDKLPYATEFVQVGWFALLATVAVALVIGAERRRVVAALGVGLAAGQIALLVGLIYSMLHTPRYLILGARVLPGSTDTVPTQLGLGVYCAFAAVVLFAGALLLAGGAWRRPGPAAVDETEEADEVDGSLRPPADLTVTPLPGHDQSVWSNRETGMPGETGRR
jgi:hypothetical protein